MRCEKMNEILYSRNYADMITATNPPHSWYVEEAIKGRRGGSLCKDSSNYNYLNSKTGSIKIDSSLKIISRNM